MTEKWRSHVTLPLTADLPYGKTRQPSMKLPFVEHAEIGKQARFKGRIALKPEIDFDDYRFEAVIDWIEIRVMLAAKTQPKYVQEVLCFFQNRDSHIVAVATCNGAGSIFDVVLQEPKSAAWVSTVCGALEGRFGFAASPRVMGLEISLDGTPRVPSDEARALLVGVLQKTVYTTQDIWSLSSSRPRSIRGPSGPDPLNQSTRKLLKEARWGVQSLGYLHPENHCPPWIDGTLYLGARDDDVMIRVMDKVVDRQNAGAKTFKALDDTEKRARIEVTLRNDALSNLGVDTLGDLKHFSFGRLQRMFFPFKLPTFQVEVRSEMANAEMINAEKERRRAACFLSSGVVGLRARDDAFEQFRSSMTPQLRKDCRDRGRSFSSRRPGSGPAGTFAAYSELNRCASNALMKLEERERRAWLRF
jgi:hypothetical protein